MSDKPAIPETWNDCGRRKRHLIGEVQDGDERLIASKWWSDKKQRWVYEIEADWDVEQQMEIMRKTASDRCTS